MHIFVTGASGYIGKHVVNEALSRGFTVSVCDMQYANLDPRAHIVQAEILSGEPDLFRILGKPDVLIHLAWRNGFIHNSPSHMLDLSAHYRFLRDMALGGCKRIAVMGSMHEIGYWEGAIDEHTPCAPLSQYGIAKNALRQALQILAIDSPFSLYWLRGYYIFGDDKRGSSIFSKIAAAAQEGKKEFPFTRGQSKYDFISVQELACQIVSACTQDAITGIINVCSGKPVSLAEKVEEFIKDHGYQLELLYGAYPDRPYDSPAVWGDDSRIREILSKAKYESEQ